MVVLPITCHISRAATDGTTYLSRLPRCHRSNYLTVTPPALPLIDVHGGNEHRAHHHLLPERPHPENLKPVLQHHRNEHPDNRPHHSPHAAEQRGPADHH